MDAMCRVKNERQENDQSIRQPRHCMCYSTLEIRRETCKTEVLSWSV